MTSLVPTLAPPPPNQVAQTVLAVPQIRVPARSISRPRGLAPSDTDHRRVLAVLRYLES